MDIRTKPKRAPKSSASAPRQNTDELAILQSRSLRQAVQETILNLILNGAIQSGERLNEFELAARLKISRGPVREAFRALEGAGLLYSTKNRGVFVRDISPEEAEDLYNVRACLEAFACRLLAPKITVEQVRELEQIVDGMAPAYERQDVNEFYPRNVHFHNRIVEMANSPKLVALYRNLINEIHLISRRGLARDGGRLTKSLEHRAIVAALKKHDASKAENLMSKHITESGQRFTKPTTKPNSRVKLKTRKTKKP
ncbi:FCD domain-containing protein [Bradyrhizobium sp. SYSU BS000235]|uniref:FCD domain-containing protein n=1 Tax=Bradyrhizobium sp. SYSU BS000235 TaxID=3411332 RepID=UPI003C767607